MAPSIPAPVHPLRRMVDSPLARILLPLIVLGVFSAVIFAPGGLFHRKLSPERSKELAQKSQALMADGKYQAALDPTLTLSQAYPDNHVYIGRLATIYDHLGRYREEAEQWEKYMDHAPVPIEACPQIGQAYWKQGDAKEKEAIAAFERCLALDTTNPDSIFYLAHALEKADQPDRALQVYERGVKVAPENTDLRLGLARIWYRQDKVADAKNAVLQVLAKNPDNVDALLTAGMIYYNKEDNLAEAKKYLNHGAQLSPRYVDLHRLLARIAEDEKNTPEAVRQYNLVLELDPSDQRSRSHRDALVAQQ